MISQIKKSIKSLLKRFLLKVFPEIAYVYNLTTKKIVWDQISCIMENTETSTKVKLYGPYSIYDSSIGAFSYISKNAVINNTTIGKFCSIGPNLLCGWGIHPTNKLSTCPMFYSTLKQNGETLSTSNKVQETKPIAIGNDVFIGMNVTILDGITISDGAIIGAGSIVSKNIPPYAIAVGNPIRIIKYRFEDDKVKALLKIKWWNWNSEKLLDVEKYFDDLEGFIEKYGS